MAFDVPPDEAVTRFVFDSGHLRAGAPRIKYSAFLPPRSGKLSVYWVSGMPDAEIWSICALQVTPAKGKPVRLRGDFNSLMAYRQQLRIEVDGNPHPRHANIVGWDADSTKARLQALRLADIAAPVTPP